MYCGSLKILNILGRGSVFACRTGLTYIADPAYMSIFSTGDELFEGRNRTSCSNSVHVVGID